MKYICLKKQILIIDLSWDILNTAFGKYKENIYIHNECIQNQKTLE